MRKIIVILLTAVLLFSTFTSSASAEVGISFSDVKKDDWFYSNVIKMADLGILNGYLDGTFKPNNTLKFEEFIKMLITATEKEKIEVLQGEKWYQNYIDIALEKNYITNDMTKLIGANIDRKAMAEIIYNFMTSSGEDMDKLNEKEMAFLADKFSDLKASNIKTLYIAYMGIINGYPDKTFKPGNSLKRSEATTVILRMLDKSKRTPIEIVLPKELSDFPAPDMQFLYDYPTMNGMTVKEYYNWANNKFTNYEAVAQDIKCIKDYIELIVNRDYKTINEPRTLDFTMNYWEPQSKSMNYKEWLLYYLNAYKEYCGEGYYDLKSEALKYMKNTQWIESQKDWFEYFQDKFVQDTIDNQVVVQGEFYTADDMHVWANSASAVRGIVRFRFDNHNNPSNIKEELDLLARNRLKKDQEENNKFNPDSDILNDYSIYMNFKDIPNIKVGQWYEMAVDIVGRPRSPIHGIEELIGGKADFNYEYLYVIYIKELK